MPPSPTPSPDDELERLRRDNERLRRELLRRGAGHRYWPVAAGLLTHLALRPVLDPWLNASSDAKLAGAVVLLALPLVGAAVALVRASGA